MNHWQIGVCQEFASALRCSPGARVGGRQGIPWVSNHWGDTTCQSSQSRCWCFFWHWLDTPPSSSRSTGPRQVWSLNPFYSAQSRIGVKKCFFNKRTIKVCVCCCWRSPGTSAPRASHLTASLFLYSSRSIVLEARQEGSRGHTWPNLWFLYTARWFYSKWDGLKISPICLLQCCDKISVLAIFSNHRYSHRCPQKR